MDFERDLGDRRLAEEQPADGAREIKHTRLADMVPLL